jgi:hypothetical protein
MKTTTPEMRQRKFINFPYKKIYSLKTNIQMIFQFGIMRHYVKETYVCSITKMYF